MAEPQVGNALVDRPGLTGGKAYDGRPTPRADLLPHRRRSHRSDSNLNAA